jgi:hypothetical protein
MTMFNKASKPQNRIDSLIGATTRIEGNVIFSGGLRVDGMVRGNVASVAEQPGTLVVSAEARIDGEVQAAHIVVNGTINGPVHATELQKHRNPAGRGGRGKTRAPQRRSERRGAEARLRRVTGGSRRLTNGALK